MKNSLAFLFALALAASAHADAPARHLAKPGVLMGDMSIRGSLAIASRADVLWSADGQSGALEATFVVQTKSGPVSARLSADGAGAGANGTRAGTLAIGNAAYPATIRVGAKSCEDDWCWFTAEATASNVDGETVTVYVSGQ